MDIVLRNSTPAEFIYNNFDEVGELNNHDED